LKYPGTISNTLYSCDLGFFYISKFLFNENSHFAIISAAVTASFIYNIKYYLKNYFVLIFYLLFLIFTLGSFSLTFYLSMLSTIIIIFITTKNLSKLSIYLFVLLALLLNAFLFLGIGARGFTLVEEHNSIKNKEQILFLNINNKKRCKSNSTSEANKIFSKKSGDSKFFQKKNETKNELRFKGHIQSEKKKLKSFFKKDNNNLSTGIYIYSFYVAKKSIIENPFGVGINNYKKYRTIVDKTLKIVHPEIYKEKQLGGKIIFKESYMPSLTSIVLDFNKNSGSNNFSKLIVEFGIISAVGLLLIFIFSFKKELDDSIKITLIPMLFTQCFIRGTGYFYSGFLITLTIALIIILGLIIKKHENKISK